MNNLTKEEIQNIDDLGFKDRAGYKNLLAIIDYSKATRKLIREFEVERKQILNSNLQLKEEITLLKEQILNLQKKTINM